MRKIWLGINAVLLCICTGLNDKNDGMMRNDQGYANSDF